jgi:hypothetical protein
MKKIVLSCILLAIVLFISCFIVAKQKAYARLGNVAEIMKLDSWLWLPCMTHTLVENGTSVEIGKYGPIFMFDFIPKDVSRNAFCVGRPIIAVWVLMFGPVVYINTPYSSDFDADKEMILENFRKLQQESRETSEETSTKKD